MLRIAVVALVAVLGFSHSAFAEFSGDLLSYGELMSLSSAKRMSYLSEIRELMAQMEEDQQQYEVSSNSEPNLNEKIATMWQLFNPLPDANAVANSEDQAVRDAAANPTPPPAAAAAPTTPASAEAEPTTTTPPKKEVAAPDEDEDAAPTKATTKAVPRPPTRPRKAAAASGDNCPAPNFNCSRMSAKDRQEAIQKFRGDHSTGSNICVSGGFFSTYAGRDKKAHTCHIYHEFPPGSKTPIFSCKKEGGAPKALCNPLLYCLAVKGKAGASGKAKLNPVMNCVDYGGKAGSNITQACDAWYNKAKGQAFSKEHPNVLKEACDPAQVSADLMKGAKESWEEIRKAMSVKYDKFCMHNKGFESLFCGTCKIMAKHIHRANKAAKGSGCAPESAAPVKAEAPPADAEKPGTAE